MKIKQIASAAQSNDDSISFDEKDPQDPRIDEIRNSLKCINDVFIGLVEEYKELKKYHTMYKAFASNINLMFDVCEKADNPELKKE